MPSRCPLHIVTGKGGVGKTTVALALAHRLAAAGARVVVAEVEGRGGLALATGRPVGATPTELAGRRLLGVQIDPRAALAGYLQRHYRMGFAAGLLQVEALVDFATRIAPGLRDILLIGQVTHLTETYPEVDVLVLDAPPAGRVGSFLGAGESLAELTDGSPIAEQAASVMADLRDPGCRTHVVSLLEELPVTEAMDTLRTLDELGLATGPVIANRCLDPVAVPDVPPPPPDGIDEDSWRSMTGALDAESTRQRAQSAWLALLEYRTARPVVRLPELEPDTDAVTAARLAAHLELP